MQDTGSECKSMIGCEFLPIGKTPQTPNPPPRGPTNSLVLNSYRYFSLLCSQWRWIWDCPTCHRRRRSPPSNFLRHHFCSLFHFLQTFSPHFLPLVVWLFLAVQDSSIGDLVTDRVSERLLICRHYSDTTVKLQWNYSDTTVIVTMTTETAI